MLAESYPTAANVTLVVGIMILLIYAVVKIYSGDGDEFL